MQDKSTLHKIWRTTQKIDTVKKKTLQTSDAQGHMWSRSRWKYNARPSHNVQVHFNTWRCAPASDTAASRSNRTQRRRYVGISSAASQQNKHHVDTFSAVLQAGVSPTATFSAEPKLKEPRTNAVRVGCGYGCWLVVGSGRLSLPKHDLDIVGKFKTKNKERIRIAEASGISREMFDNLSCLKTRHVSPSSLNFDVFFSVMT